MANSDDLVTCGNFAGTQTYQVTRDKIFFRPSVYGLVAQAQRLLLIQLRNGQYLLPGGGIEKGERIEAALHREIFEEAGIEISIDAFHTISEEVIYFPRDDVAAHFHRFIFRCIPHATEVTNAYNIATVAAHELPCWIAFDALQTSDFFARAHAEIVFEYLRHHQSAK